MAHKLRNIKIIFLAVLVMVLFVLIIYLVGNLFSTEEKIMFIDSLKQSIKSIIIVKNLIMSAEKRRKVSVK